MSSLQARLLFGALIIGALAAVAWIDLELWPGSAVTCLLGALAFFGSLEYAALLKKVDLPVWRGGLAGAAAALYAGLLFSGGPLSGLWAVLGNPLFMVVGLAIATLGCAMVRGDLERGFDRGSWTVMGFVYVPLALSTLVWIRGETSAGMLVLLWLVCVAKSGDICGYFFGRAFGRRKAFPHLSPGKTIEGCTASLVGAVLVGIALGRGLGWVEDLGLLALLGAGIITNLFAQAGDLSESLLKRRVGAKDSSSLLPGFGGILDLIDSLLLAGPAFLAFRTLLN